MFKVTSTQAGARVGRLRTLHGVVETPVFLPVCTKAAAKHLSSMELKAAATQAVISNSFLLSLRPGVETVKALGGLHRFMDWQKTIFTDSGGFQFLNKPFFVRTSEHGGSFRSPFDGKELIVTPEDAIRVQEGLGSDVMMCLDEMPLYHQTRLQVASATRHTHAWARRCLAARSNPKQLLFGIVQGGVFADMRAKSAEFISRLDFDGISIGGLAVGEPRESMEQMLKVALPLLPQDKPRYLMGVGSPQDILKAVSMGVDIFDSAFPTQNARHGTLFTSEGNLKVTNQGYRQDKRPVDGACTCYLCRNLSRAYLHHLFRMKEALGLRLASLHNVTFLNQLLRRIRLSIKQGDFSPSLR